ncbi:MAG: hypothetical protein J6Y43_06970 [Clostridia bacterium]|nr:hypothetical protein [Clostridia bacterium]
MKKTYVKAEIRVVCGFADTVLTSVSGNSDENHDFTVNDIFEGWWLR